MPITSFTGEIVMTPYTFPPRNFIDCDGTVLAINQLPALYSIIGSFFGGDDVSIFMVPNMQERIPMHSGTGPGLSSRSIGQKPGINEVILTEDQLPQHSHTLGALRDGQRTDNLDDPTITLGIPLDTAGNTIYAYGGNAANTPLNNQAISYTGLNQGHENRQPHLAVRFVMCADGVYPRRS